MCVQELSAPACKNNPEWVHHSNWIKKANSNPVSHRFLSAFSIAITSKSWSSRSTFAWPAGELQEDHAATIAKTSVRYPHSNKALHSGSETGRLLYTLGICEEWNAVKDSFENPDRRTLGRERGGLGGIYSLFGHPFSQNDNQ